MIVTFLAMVGFSGCASTTGIAGVSDTGVKYKLSKEDGFYQVHLYDFANDSIYSNSTEKDYKRVLYTQLNVAAKETKRMGYNYFLVTNSKISNLNGFPINRASELNRFITLKARKPSFATNGSGKKSTLIRTGEMLLRFKPVSADLANNGLISVWSVSQTLKDTQ